ncbi:unnamed protein product [Larinioides sclopetarius]|uniref:Amine oxidase n=1 Tax=Larinioides sclopetarius TaxID=280406 RepID=A0AAV2BYF4_9ARAC
MWKWNHICIITLQDPKVNYVDLGASYIGPTQDHLLRLSEELGVKNYKLNHELKSVYYRNGRRLFHDATAFPYERNPFVNMDLNYIIKLIDKMGEEIPANSPWDAPHAEEWDLLTVKDFLKEHCWTKRAADFCKELCGIFITSEEYEASLLMFLWYVKQCGGMKRMVSAVNGGQERKFHGGSQQISEKLAEKLGDNVVLTNCPVVCIDQESKDFVLVKTLPGKEYKFGVKFIWKSLGLSGTHFIVGDDEHPMFFSMDDTKPDGSFPAIVGYISGDKCRKMCHMTAEERKNAITLSLEKASGCPEILQKSIINLHFRALRTPIDRLYFAGTETSIKWSGYMNGAVEAGERAAREVLCAMGKITADMIWIKEPEFQDVPALPFEDTFGEKYTPSVSSFLKFVSFTSILGAATFAFLKYPKYFRK